MSILDGWYWAVRSKKDMEIFGIFKVDRPGRLTGSMIEPIKKQVGHNDWWFSIITKVEYETYREFGFIEYKI